MAGRDLGAEAAALLRDAVTIDATSPLLRDAKREYVDMYVRGGWTCVAPTVGGPEDAPFTLRSIGRWLAALRERPDLLLVRSADDIARAKREGRLAIVMHLQGTDPIEDSLDLIDAYKAMGVGVMQLAYNVRNRVGDGAEEPDDAGLSRFGRRVIARLNAARIVIDCAHTGRRTSLEAIEASSAPVVISHTAMQAVHPVARNSGDEVLRAIAASGGVIGVLGFPWLIADRERPTLDHYIAHIDHVVSLCGIGHVGIAVDYFRWQHPLVSVEAAQAMRDDYVARGLWDGTTYRNAPFHYPEGFEAPDKLPNLVEALLRRGYSEADVRAIMGENWLRVWRRVWDEANV
jgi:membrane dipeptidase